MLCCRLDLARCGNDDSTNLILASPASLFPTSTPSNTNELPEVHQLKTSQPPAFIALLLLDPESKIAVANAPRMPRADRPTLLALSSTIREYPTSVQWLYSEIKQSRINILITLEQGIFTGRFHLSPLSRIAWHHMPFGSSTSISQQLQYIEPSPSCNPLSSFHIA